MTLRRYSGTFSPSNASMISSHLAVLSAFRISKSMIAHIRFVHRLPLTVFLATHATLLMESSVDRLFLKPNLLSRKPSTCCIAASSLTDMIRSNNFPTISSMQSGLYENGSSGGLFSLGRSTNLCIFHFTGNIYSLRQA